MRVIHLLTPVLAAIVPARADDPTPRPVMGTIVRVDPALDALLDPDAKLDVLASGLNWSEGPVWSKELGAVLFSDVPENHVLQWKEGEGMSVYLKPSGFTGILPYSREPGSNGLTFNARGELCSCEHGDRRGPLGRADAGAEGASVRLQPERQRGARLVPH